MNKALKSTEEGRFYLEELRSFNEQQILRRDVLRETELAGKEGREVNPNNIRYLEKYRDVIGHSGRYLFANARRATTRLRPASFAS